MLMKLIRRRKKITREQEREKGRGEIMETDTITRILYDKKKKEEFANAIEYDVEKVKTSSQA